VNLAVSPLFKILQKVCLEEEPPELFKVDLIDLKAVQPTHDPHEVLKIYHQVMLQPESEAVGAEELLPPPAIGTEVRDQEMREEQPSGEVVQQEAV
jgi:hypothetical protein